MAGITDKAFRIIAKRQGCGLIYTEMISAKALVYGNVKTRTLLDLKGETQPIAVQLFGWEPDIMAEAAGIAVDAGARIIDVNMGCPVPKVVKNREGAALLGMPQVARDIVAAIKKRTNVPVSVKMRTGLSAERIVAVPFAQCMEAAGASLIAVHGRTREQYYSGKADWDIIGAVKAAVRVPVIGNGDIWRPEDAGEMLKRTGCDGVMIGRGALGNPWLLRRTLQYVRSVPVDPPPSPGEKIRGALEHLELMAVYKNEAKAITEMRKHLTWYLKGLRHTAPLKAALFRCRQKEEIRALLNDWAQEYLEPAEGIKLGFGA
jgi:nifR3 family TIM-barrel protein